MKIAIAQMDTRAGDFDQTIDRLLKTAEVAKGLGADLVVVGSPTVTGTLPPEAASVGGYALDFQYAANRLHEELVCPVLLPYSCGTEGTDPKLALLGAHGRGSLFGSMLYGWDADPNKTHLVWRMRLNDKRFAFALSYEDLDHQVNSDEDFDVLCFFTSYGCAADDESSAMGAALDKSRFVDDAKYLGCWFMGIAGVGGYGTDVFGGGSFVLNPAAELVALAPSFEECLIVADLDFDSEWERRPSLPIPSYNRLAFLWGCASLGIRDYIFEREAKGCCLVLDGSLDSSVLAALAVDAVGPESVTALVADDLEFPDGAGSTAARELAKSLHIRCVEASIANDVLKEDADAYRSLVMVKLGDLSRSVGAMPFESWDKTALALEVSEGLPRVASLLPLGDVYRGDVLELALYRNTVSPVIPPHSFRAYSVPDVEGLKEFALSPEMCIRYCDDVLLSFVEWERGLSEVIEDTGIGNVDVVTRIVRRFCDLEPQRRLAAPVLRLSSRALCDVSIPLNNVWRPRIWSREEQLNYARMVRAYKESPDYDYTGYSSAPADPRELGRRLDKFSNPGGDRSARDDSSDDPFGAAIRERIDHLRNEERSALLGEPLEGNAVENDGSARQEEDLREVSERLDPEELNQALGSVFDLLQDLMQSGTLIPEDIGEGKEGHDQRGWEYLFSDN